MFLYILGAIAVLLLCVIYYVTVLMVPVPKTQCPSGMTQGSGVDAGYCYQNCPQGTSWNKDLKICTTNCPDGYADSGVSCTKPVAYGRGAGYGWMIGDPVGDFSNTMKRCEASHGVGKCEMDGLIAYPKCSKGFTAYGCCLCQPTCPAGTIDNGLLCTKSLLSPPAKLLKDVGRCPVGWYNKGGICTPLIG